MRDWQNFFELDDFVGERWMKEEMLKHCNAKIREAVEAAPKVYQDPLIGWCIRNDGDAKSSARLVDVKPIEKGEG